MARKHWGYMSGAEMACLYGFWLLVTLMAIAVVGGIGLGVAWALGLTVD